MSVHTKRVADQFPFLIKRDCAVEQGCLIQSKRTAIQHFHLGQHLNLAGLWPLRTRSGSSDTERCHIRTEHPEFFRNVWLNG